MRAPLAHLANQVFLELANELAAQGISRKVSADMFGMALRSYRRRVQRLAGSETDRGRSLWEAILEYLSQRDLVSRNEILNRFRRDEEAFVRGVLKDLCESGLVFKIGAGHDTAYRAATTRELRQLGAKEGGPEQLVWIMVYREGPIGVDELLKMTGMGRGLLERWLEDLETDGRIERTASGTYKSRAMVVPLGDPAGWEAAMFDHFQAMVQTMCQRLRASGEPDPDAGGSTYSFNIWPGHPYEEQARSILRRFRQQSTELRQRIQDYNAKQTLPGHYKHITVYAGQCSIERRRDEDDVVDAI